MSAVPRSSELRRSGALASGAEAAGPTAEMPLAAADDGAARAARRAQRPACSEANRVSCSSAAVTTARKSSSAEESVAAGALDDAAGVADMQRTWEFFSGSTGKKKNQKMEGAPRA